jgi:hypothetical protein
MTNPEWLDEGILSRQIQQGNDITRLTEKIDHLVAVVDQKFAIQQETLSCQGKALLEIKESVRKYKWLNRVAGSIIGIALVGTGSLAPDQLGNFAKSFKGLI